MTDNTLKDIEYESINDDKIDKLSKLVKDQHDEMLATQKEIQEKADQQKEKADQQHIDMITKVDKLLSKNKKISKKLSVVKEQNEEISQQNDELLEKVTDISADRVVEAPNKNDKHVFIIMKDDDEDTPANEQYYVIRTKRRTHKHAVKRYQGLHPESKILINIEYNPNSINMWDRVRASLKRKIRCRLNNFGLKGEYSEDQLIADIDDINEEKFDV